MGFFIHMDLYFPVKFYADKYAIPADMFLAIAMVESSLNPSAIGDEGHSVGMFQLHDQGAGAGMSIQDRLYPANSAQTAAAYLAELYQDTDQTWNSAISAYNQGLAGWKVRGTAFNRGYVDRVNAWWRTFQNEGWDWDRPIWWRQA